MPGSLTRIRNNQVYSSDIDAATKIVPGSITGALFSTAALTYTGNLTVGNLTVNGITTSLDTTNVVASDPLIVLNRNFSGANTYDVGLVLGRGNQTNTAMIWNESNKEFAFTYTSESTAGTTTGTINNSGYANIHAYGGLFNNVTVTTATLTTAGITNLSTANARITGAYIDGSAIGANTANSGVFTSVTTVSGGQLTGYHTGVIGANSANAGTFTTLTATSGYQGAASGPLNGTIGATTANSGVFTTLTATSGYQGSASGALNGTLGAGTPNSVVATSVTTTSGGQLTGYHTGVIGANTANAGTFTTLTATSGYQGAASGPLNGTLGAGTPNTVVATSVTTTSGGQVIGYMTGPIGANTPNSGAFTTLTITGGLQNTPVGNTTASTGAFTTLTATSGYQGAASGPLNGTLGAGTPNSVVATSVTTTSGGQLTGYHTGPIGANTANSGVFTSVTTVSGGQITGYMTGVIGANTANAGTFTTLTATSGYQGAASGPLNGTLGATTPNSVVATSVTTTSGGQLTGYHTGPIGANTANTGAFTTLTSSGLTTFTNATEASAYNTASVVLSGGLGVTKDAWVHGNLTVDGNLLVQGGRTVIGATTFSVLDPIIDIHTYANLAALTFNDGFDVGFKLHYFDTLDTHGFLGRDNASGYLVWEDKGTDTANVFTPTSFGTFKAGTFLSVNTTVSTSTTTGALQTAGGAGIAGNLYVGGGINGIIGNGTAAAGTFTSVTTTSGGQLTGYHTGAIGANTANTGVFTSVTTTSGGQLTGYHTGPIGANTPNSVVATSVTTTSGGQVTGYMTGPIGANTANTGVFTNVTTVSGGQVTGYMTGPIGANTPNSVVATSVTTTSGGQITGYHTGPIGANTANSGVFTTLTATSGYQGAASGPLNGTLGATTPNSVVATSVTTTSGGQLTGYLTGPIGANTANSGVFTSVTTTSGGQVTGYMTGPIGANTANSGAFTTLTASSTATVSGNLVAAATTSSTSTTTGALVVRGGAGIAGDVKIGTSLEVNSGAYGNVTTTQYAAVFGSGGGANPYSVMQVRSSDGVSGLGMQAYTGSGVLYGNVIGFVTNATIRDRDIYSGGTLTTYFASNGAIINTTGIASTTTGTGALIVSGGAGISGNVYSGSWLNATTGVGAPTHGADTITPYSTTNININTPVNGNVVINNSGLAANLIVQGNTTAGYQNLLVTNGATGQVGIKIAPNAMQAATSFQINATDSMILPVGSTGQRPSAGQVTKGMLRFNNSLNLTEFWDGTQWNTGAATFTLISSDSFTGNGSQTAFTLSQTGTTASTVVMINGVVQIPTTAYSVSGTTLTFTEAPLSTDIIDARVLSTTVSVSNIYDGTTQIALSNSAAVIYDTVRGTNVYVATASLTTISNPISVNSANNVTAIANGGTNGVGNIGATGATFNTVFAKATTAQYADLAECYAADAEYEPGTVLEFGGDNEVTISSNDASAFVAGVVSTNPAHLMNSAIEAEHSVALALTGRVPTKIVGPVTKGQMMVSAGNGRARAETNPAMGSVIGKAVENFGEGPGVIEVVVGRL